jgi:hypothetical protein
VLGGAALALLAGPAAYSIATVGHGQTGSSPTAGPAGVGRSGGGNPGGFARFGQRGAGIGVGTAPRSFAGRGAGAGSDVANAQLVKYLKQNRDGAKYLVAATGSQTAAPIALATGDPVITMGGFMGADPAPTVAQLTSLIRAGQLRYVLLGGGGFGGGAFGGGGSGGEFGAVSGDGARGDAGVAGGHGAGRASSAVSAARTTWVQTHCQPVSLPSGTSGSSAAGASGSSSAAGGRGAGSTLYRCTPADATS